MQYQPENRSITTEKLILRPFVAADLPVIVELLNDEQVTRSTHAWTVPFTEDYAARWIAGDPRYVEAEGRDIFAITDRASGELYGFICLLGELADNRAEFGYALGRRYWGRGIATEATKALIDFGFQVRKYHKVYARHFVTNPASGRVMQKCGMQFEGTQLSHDYKDGHYEDVSSYGILNPAE